MDYCDIVKDSSIPIQEYVCRNPKVNELETFYNLLKAIGIKNITSHNPLTLENLTKELISYEVLVADYRLVTPILSWLCHQYFGVYYLLFSEIFRQFKENKLQVSEIMEHLRRFMNYKCAIMVTTS
jgi:hypothetical protein